MVPGKRISHNADLIVQFDIIIYAASCVISLRVPQHIPEIVSFRNTIPDDIVFITGSELRDAVPDLSKELCHFNLPHIIKKRFPASGRSA